MRALIDVAFSPLKRKATSAMLARSVDAPDDPSASTLQEKEASTFSRRSRVSPRAPASLPSQLLGEVQSTSLSPFGQRHNVLLRPPNHLESSRRSDGRSKRLTGRLANTNLSHGDESPPEWQAMKTLPISRSENRTSVQPLGEDQQPIRLGVAREDVPEYFPNHFQTGTTARPPRCMSVGAGSLPVTNQPMRLNATSGTIHGPDDNHPPVLRAPQHRRKSTGTNAAAKGDENVSRLRQPRRMSSGAFLLSAPQMRGATSADKSHLTRQRRLSAGPGTSRDRMERQKQQTRRMSAGPGIQLNPAYSMRTSARSSDPQRRASLSQQSDDFYYRHPYYREPQPGGVSNQKPVWCPSISLENKGHHAQRNEHVPASSCHNTTRAFDDTECDVKVSSVRSPGDITRSPDLARGSSPSKVKAPHKQSSVSSTPPSVSDQSGKSNRLASATLPNENSHRRSVSTSFNASPRPRFSPSVSRHLSQKDFEETVCDEAGSHRLRCLGVSRAPQFSAGASEAGSHGMRGSNVYSNLPLPLANKVESQEFPTDSERYSSAERRGSMELYRVRRMGSNDYCPSLPVRSRTLQSNDPCMEFLAQTERRSVCHASPQDDGIVLAEEEIELCVKDTESKQDAVASDEVEEFHHHAAATPHPTGLKPTKLYEHARRCQWDKVLEECSRNHRDASFVCPKDGTTALHLAVMSRCNPLLRNGDLDGYKPAPRLILEALLVACPEAAITRCNVKKYTPLTYACLVTDKDFDMSDAADMVITILRHAPQSAYVFTDDGFSALDIHIMSYSRLHGHKEEVYSGDRTSTVVLRTLLEEKPVLADARTYRNKIRGPLELLYRCNMEEFKEAVTGGPLRSKPKHLTSVVSTLDDWWAWKWAQLLMKYASLSNEEVKINRPFCAVQTAARLVGCPSEILSLAIAMFPHQVESRDPRGELYNLPLHEVASWRCNAEIICGDPFVIRRKARAIQLLLDEYPAAARTTNNMGETALQLAIEAGTPWHGGLERLVLACPKALKFPRKLRSRTDENKTLISVSIHSDIDSVDSENEEPEAALEGMYPFMIAAVLSRVPHSLQRDPSFLFEGQSVKEHGQNLAKKDLESVRSIYGLLRARPDALSCYISYLRKES